MFRNRRGSPRPGSQGDRSSSTESMTSLVTDTGTRLEFTGKLALCIENGAEYFGVECPNCDCVCLDIRVWTRCNNCGELVVKISPDFRPCTGLRVDWTTGATTVISSRAVDVRSLPSLCSLTSPSSEGSSTSLSWGPAVQKYGYAVARDRRRRTETETESESESELTELPQPLTPIEEIESLHGEPVLLTGKIDSLTEETGSAKVMEVADQILTTEESEMAITETEDEPEDVADKKHRVVLKQIVEKAGLTPSYAARRIEGMAIAKTPAQYQAYSAAHTELIRRAPDPYVLPGRGDIMTLGRLSRFQRIVSDRVVLEYGLEYPYCPEEIMDEVERNRTHWCCEEVWKYLQVPKPYRNSDNKEFHEHFKACFQEWKLGRSIYKDRIEIVRKDGSVKTRSVPQMISGRGMVNMPNPLYYR